VIVTDVTRGIYESQIVLADITGRNSNVMYELGLAHAAKKPVIILAQSDSDVPFDIRHIRYMNYTPLDLTALKSNLVQRIRNTLASVDEPLPDLFPQLKIMTTAEIAELEYLRERTLPLDVVVDPPTADIFFNDVWMGRTPQTIRINMLANRRVLAVTAPEHIEYYQDITDDEVHSRRLHIKLEPGRPDKTTEKRMPGWLRQRRRDPDSPVLMKAISQYFCEIGAFEDALKEAKDLVNEVPAWPVAQGHLGDVYHRMGRYEEAIQQWQITVKLRSDYAVPYFGMACAYAMTGAFAECIDTLERIASSAAMLETYRHMGNWRIEEDRDFDGIRGAAEYAERFAAVVRKINETTPRGRMP
jgi:tetratricopeptide (TPR) repeat protein